ncbi:MAG: hypothetical protein ACTHZ9_12360 [Leucobacter sp.]
MNVKNRHLDVTALGVTVRLEFADDCSERFEQQVRSAWSSAVTRGTEPNRSIVISEVTDEARRLELLSMQATLEALDHQRGKLVMFHAAGVALEDGRVVAFVGPSGRGKTTLSRALGAHFGYVSDETIAVDAELNVYPYRKPLSVVREGKPKQQVSPGGVGLLDLPERELTLSCLVLIERDERVVEPSIEEVPFLSALTDLVPQMSYLPEIPNPLQRLASLCDSVGGVVRVRYANAPDVAQLMPQLLERTPVDATWEPCLESVEGPYRTDVVDDAIRVDDRIVVLGDGQVQVLDGIAPAIWDAACSGRDEAGLVEHVINEYGVPDGADAATLVRAALESLMSAGVLRHSS